MRDQEGGLARAAGPEEWAKFNKETTYETHQADRRDSRDCA